MSSTTKKAGGKESSARSRTRQPDDRAAGANGKLRSVDEQIQLRAYELYLERGAQPNDDLGDWLRAEIEVRQAPGASAS